MLQYLVNLYIGKGVINSGFEKVKNKGEVGEETKEMFNVNSSQMKIAGYLETAGAVFLFLSFLGKTFTRIGTLMVSIVLGTAVFKHFKAGHGVEGSKNAASLLGLSVVSLLETFKKS